jgi:hypothetical protein
MATHDLLWLLEQRHIAEPWWLWRVGTICAALFIIILRPHGTNSNKKLPRDFILVLYRGSSIASLLALAAALVAALWTRAQSQRSTYVTLVFACAVLTPVSRSDGTDAQRSSQTWATGCAPMAAAVACAHSQLVVQLTRARGTLQSVRMEVDVGCGVEQGPLVSSLGPNPRAARNDRNKFYGDGRLVGMAPEGAPRHGL